ncbi:hypothetical protein A2U01_0064949, partial [Trifolium medium]|nr:hypothetical protein [Trifolium medium]
MASTEKILVGISGANQRQT